MISGRSGVALVMDGDRLASIHASDPERWVPRRAEELHFLLGEGEDFVPLEDVTRDEIVHRLLLARKSEDALHLALIAQDPEMPDSLRRRSVKNLERLLHEGEVGNALEGILYAQPLPPGLDVAGAMRHAREAEALEVQTLLELLWTYQAQIREVREAWEAIPQELFEDQADHRQATAVREGVFHDLARCRARGRVNEFLAEVHQRSAIQRLPNYRIVLQNWLSPFLKKDLTPTREEAEFMVAEASFVYEEERPYEGPQLSASRRTRGVKTCPLCAMPIGDRLICQHCGLNQDPKRQQLCRRGHVNSATWKYCKTCGVKLGKPKPDHGRAQ